MSLLDIHDQTRLATRDFVESLITDLHASGIDKLEACDIGATFLIAAAVGVRLALLGAPAISNERILDLVSRVNEMVAKEVGL